MEIPLEITNGAYFRARVFHIAYNRAAEQLDRKSLGTWESLSREDRRHLAGAFQLMIDMDLIEPLSLNQARILRAHQWVKRPSIPQEDT